MEDAPLLSSRLPATATSRPHGCTSVPSSFQWVRSQHHIIHHEHMQYCSHLSSIHCLKTHQACHYLHLPLACTWCYCMFGCVSIGKLEHPSYSYTVHPSALTASTLRYAHRVGMIGSAQPSIYVAPKRSERMMYITPHMTRFASYASGSHGHV